MTRISASLFTTTASVHVEISCWWHQVQIILHYNLSKVFFTIVLFLRKPGHHMLYMEEMPNMPLSLSLLLLFFPHSITKNFRHYPEVLSLVLTLCVTRYIAFYIAR